MNPWVERIAGIVARRASTQAAAWYADQLQSGDFVTAFSGAGRRLGQAPVADEGLPVSLAGRGLDEVGRVALLLALNGDVNEAFWKGDARERQAVLRALPLLGKPLVEIGVEAVRSSLGGVFEAIACENPFPADHFSDAQFNQMVLKALFNEVKVSRIVGLERRVTPELVRMVQGYASERRAAGRTVPADIDVIVRMLK